MSAKMLPYILTTKSNPIINEKDYATNNHPLYNKILNVYYKQLQINKETKL